MSNCPPVSVRLIVSAFKQRAAHFLSPRGEKVIYQPDPTWREADAHCSLPVVSQFSESRQMLPGQTRSFALETYSCPFLLRRALTSPHQSQAKLLCDWGTVAEVCSDWYKNTPSYVLPAYLYSWVVLVEDEGSRSHGPSHKMTGELLSTAKISQVLLYWDLLKVERLGFTEKKKKKLLRTNGNIFLLASCLFIKENHFFPCATQHESFCSKELL